MALPKLASGETSGGIKPLGTAHQGTGLCPGGQLKGQRFNPHQGHGAHDQLTALQGPQGAQAVPTAPDLDPMASLAKQLGQGGTPGSTAQQSNRQGQSARPVRCQLFLANRLFLQQAQLNDFKAAAFTGFENYAWGHPIPVGLQPTGRTKAPTVTGL